MSRYTSLARTRKDLNAAMGGTIAVLPLGETVGACAM
jgi:hypothetical protein